MVDPPLSDGTVTLSPFRPDEVSAHVAGQDELTARWLSGGVVTQHSAAAYFEHCRDQWATGGPLRAFAIRVGPQQVPAGTVDLRFAGEGLAFGEVNVAYGLYPAWRGRGLATRAVDLVCRYAAQLDATVAVVKVEPENSASARVALRAGFGRTSRIREPDGNVFDRYERTLSRGFGSGSPARPISTRCSRSAPVSPRTICRSSNSPNSASPKNRCERPCAPRRACGSQMSTGSPRVSRWPMRPPAACSPALFDRSFRVAVWEAR